MALIAHWPLNGDLLDISGNNNHLIYESNTSKLVDVANGKIGRGRQRAVKQDGSDYLRSTNSVQFAGSHTFMCWAIVTDVHLATANGMITHHTYSANEGGGITIRDAGTNDYRISCNTGNGTSRTYNAYYGTTNIYNKWHHLTFRFDATTNTITLLVDGVIEQTVNNYALVNYLKTIQLFTWSVGYVNTNYKPACIMNDVRIYDEYLSLKQIKEIAKAKILHYTFNDFQEPTTNLFTSTVFTTGWTFDDTSYVNGKFQESTTVNSPRYTLQNQPVVSGTVYTQSIVAKAAERTVIQMSGSTGFSSAVYTNYDLVNGTMTGTPANGTMTYLGDGWWRCTYTTPATSTTSGRILYGLVDSITSTRIQTYVGIVGYGLYIKEPQLEAKSYATEFTTGSRTAEVNDISGFGNNTPTIPEATTPQWSDDSGIGTGSYYYDGTTSRKIELSNPGFTGFTSCSLSFWRKNDTTLKSWLPFGGQTTSYYIMAASNGTGAFFHANIGTGAKRIYKDGVYTASATPFTDTDTWHHYVITDIDLSTWTSLNLGGRTDSWDCNGYFSDVRLYNKYLSDAEVLSLYEQKASIDSHGNLFVNEVDINGIGSDYTNSIPYEQMEEDADIESTSWYDIYGTDSYINNRIYYGAQDSYSAVSEIAANPIGELDLMTKVSIDYTQFIQYRNLPVNYYFVAQPTKSYRVSQWVYMHAEPSTAYNQHVHYGVLANTVCNLNTTTANGNPYFTAPAMTGAHMERWMLWTYYIYPYASTGNPTTNAGYHYLDGTFTNTGANYNWNTGISNTYLRQYTMYQYGEIAAGSYVKRYRPRIDLIDGSEPSVETLLACAEHRPVIDNAGTRKSVAKDSKGYFTSLSNIGITHGLIGYWPLDNHALDYSGNNYDGTPTTLTYSAGVKNVAGLFNGTTSKVTSALTGVTGGDWVHSISLWFKATSIPSRKDPITIGNAAISNYSAIDINATNINWYFYSNDMSVSYTWTLGEWYHIVLTYAGGGAYANRHIYINGVDQTSYSTSGADPGGLLQMPANPNVGIGHDIGRATAFWDGSLDEIKIFDRVLSAKEVLIEYEMINSNKKMKIQKDGTLYIAGDIIEGL